jgi:autotransporter-associated beta strand protein
MSKKLNLSSALGIFLIGIFSANFSQAQINAYWDVNGVTNGQGGSGTFSSSGVFWTTNSANATANGGGPVGGGTFAVGNGAANSTATYTTNGATWTSNSGAYTFNFGGTAGTVTWGGAYQAYGVNLLSSGYIWNIDGSGANNRTITTTNAVNLGANALTLANGSRGLNSFTFAGPTTATAQGITGTSGSTLTLRNLTADSTTNSFGVYLSGGTISSNISINVDIGTGSKISFGSQSSGGMTNYAAIALNTNASGVALNITNSSSQTVAMNGVISGASGLVLDNASTGKIALNAANTYAGGTRLNNTGNGAIITFSNAAAFGTGTITSAGAVTNYVRAEVTGLDVANNWQIDSGSIVRLNAASGSITASGVIAGAGSMMFSNSGINYYLTGTNSSFGGGVAVGNGTLYFSKLGSANQNSSLGTNGTITVGGPSAATTGGLRWIGTTDETSDKTIVVAGTTGGLSLLANGATNASLTLSGNINSTGVGSKTLTFGGYSTNTLTLNGVINENGGVNSVVIGTSSSGTVVLGNTNNSFSGAITITNGTSGQYTFLRTANIGNAGVNSALGKNGTINIGSSSSTAFTTLRYTGIGETSDKVINLAGTSGGAILDQSGTGNLKFSSAMTATGLGAKAITLQGSTAGTGELAGAISDLSGNVISLNKYGSGDWTLSGNNSYSGLTTVKDAGSLLKLMSTGALSAKTSLTGENSLAAAGTIDFGAGGSYTANSFGTLSTSGNNMYFTNSSGSAVTLTFTNANNYVTGSTGGGRTLSNSSSNLNLDFDGDIEIGSTATNTTTFRGAGSFNVDGNLLDTGANGARTLQKDGEGTLTLRGSGNNYRGSTLVSNGKLDLYGSVTASTNIVVSTDGTVSAASTTRTATATLDVKSGATLLTNSTTTVYSGGNLIMNGTGGAVNVEINGLLGGSGTNNGIVTLKSGSFLTPGNSPGTLTAQEAIVLGGSTYNWEISALTGTAGTNWDLLSVTTLLDMSDITGTGTDKWNLVVTGNGAFTGWTDNRSYEYIFAQAADLILASNFSADFGTDVTSLFNITTSGISSNPNGDFKVVVGSANGLTTLNLVAVAVPEPSTGSLMFFGLGGLLLNRLIRRKVS